MTDKSMMFLAAGNLPAAIYCERNKARSYRRRVDEEAQAVVGRMTDQSLQRVTDLEPLKTFIPNSSKLGEIVRWLHGASLADLSTCKIGLATAGGGLVSWSYRTRIQRTLSPRNEITFTGKYTNLPIGTRFSKVVVTMANGDEIGRRALDRSIEISERIIQVVTNYTVSFT